MSYYDNEGVDENNIFTDEQYQRAMALVRNDERLTAVLKQWRYQQLAERYRICNGGKEPPAVQL